MAKNDQSQARQTATQNAQRVDARTAQTVPQLQTQQQNAQNRQQQTFGAAQSGYEQAQKTGGYDPNALNNIRATGGYDPGALDTMRTRISTGGYDPNQLDTIRRQSQEFTSSGGFDPASVSKISEGYSNFADTGGFTPEQAGAFRRQATSAVPAIYNVLQSEADRRRALTGGIGGGGEVAQMAREMASKTADANLAAETSLQGQIRQNQLAGLGGLSSFEQAQAGGRRAGLGLQAQTESDVAGKTLQGQQALEGDIAAGRRGTEANVAGGSLQATGGLSQLYNTTTGEISDIGRQILQQYGLQDASHQQQQQVLTQLANTPGVLDNILRVGGMASGIAGGLAGLGWKPLGQP